LSDISLEELENKERDIEANKKKEEDIIKYRIKYFKYVFD